jgi:hypothetical protein
MHAHAGRLALGVEFYGRHRDGDTHDCTSPRMRRDLFLEGRHPAGRRGLYLHISLPAMDDPDRGLLVRKVVKEKNHGPR